jgi:VanZ family protein
VPSSTLRRASLALTIAWAALIYYLSDQPGLDIPSVFPLQDKLLHLLAYGVLGFLALGTQQPLASGYRVADYWKVTALAGLYGVLDEFHQSFVPGRDADIYDVLADVSGALLGAGVLFFTVRKLGFTRRKI